MKKIYKFRVILSVKSYIEGELYERDQEDTKRLW